MMNTRIYSKGFEQAVNNAVALAYERRKPSIDFLLLFSVKRLRRATVSNLSKKILLF